MKTCGGLFFCAWLFFLGSSRALAVILLGTGDPTANTTEPTGELAGSGWQWMGKWGTSPGVAIAPNYFITVKHVGGNVLDPFVFQEKEYLAAKFYDDPATDLRIVLIVGTMPMYAPIYTQNDELGKKVVVIGRGTQRGAEVLVSGGLFVLRKGWSWGPADHVQRWGENRVSGINRNPNGGVETLAMRFDASGGPNEAHLSPGDSGGGLFIQDGFLWKLAGINNTTEAHFSLGPSGPAITAAIYDKGGLYEGGNPAWQLILDTVFDLPSSFYCIRVSARQEWIRSVIGTPPDHGPTPDIEIASTPFGPFQDTKIVFADGPSRSLALPATQNQEFYRLKGPKAVRITGVQVRNGHVWLTYE